MVWTDSVMVVYQGPPRWDGTKWVNGDRFRLSGFPRGERLQDGVELARGLSGLDRSTDEYRIDTGANTPGGDLVAVSTGRREVSGQINILGSSPAELRKHYRKWWRNHPEKEKGRLWFYTREGEPRYLSVVKTEGAGLFTNEQDPALLNRVTSMPWGWVSDYPYFYGFRTSHDLRHTGDGHFNAVFYNPSTVPEIYPDLYLPGGGKFQLSLGYGQPYFQTRPIPRGSTAKISFDPRKRTYVEKDARGNYTNLWPLMLGRRPKISLEPETRNKFTVTLMEWTNGNDQRLDGDPRIVYTPEFMSWV